MAAAGPGPAHPHHRHRHQGQGRQETLGTVIHNLIQQRHQPLVPVQGRQPSGGQGTELSLLNRKQQNPRTPARKANVGLVLLGSGSLLLLLLSFFSLYFFPFCA